MRHVLLLMLICPSAVYAQVILGPTGPQRVDTDRHEVPLGIRRVSGPHAKYELSIQPAAEPVPALRYRLWTVGIDQDPGNAVPYYYRAIMLYAESHEAYDEFDVQMDIPADKLPAKTEEAVRSFRQHVYRQLIEATRRERCDWDWRVHDLRGADVYEFLLPEVQYMRGIRQLLALKIRLAIRDGQYSQAIEDLRIGYRIAHDLAQQPILVNALAAIAVGTTMNEVTLEFIDAPGSPNLYWALTTIPDPLVDLAPALRYETEIMFHVMPVIKDPEAKELSAAAWQKEWNDWWAEYLKMAPLLSGDGAFTGIGALLRPWGDSANELAGVATVLRAYPVAKQALIQAGYDAARLQSMPAGQVVAIYQSRYVRRLVDDVQKWSYLPYHQSKEGLNNVMANFERERFASAHGEPGELMPTASPLMPAFGAARNAEARLDAQLALLRLIEAIRLHAAQTGALPASLEDIQAVPVPLDPITRKAFSFQRAETSVTVGFETETESGWTVVLNADSNVPREQSQK